MKLSPAQLKGRIKSLSQKNHADARVLMRIYMMERFLERLSVSKYRDHFIIKGGILVTSMIGIALRSTMDIDACIKNENLSEEHLLEMLQSISSIDLEDGVSFRVKHTEQIMDEMEYPGIRVAMEATIGPMPIPLKLDISTGDVITPREVEYDYHLLIEDRSISLWSYNLETVLAEKLQTVLARGILNTRMRDFYDIHELSRLYADSIDKGIFRSAFDATCKKRGTEKLVTEGSHILQALLDDSGLHHLWQSYQKKYVYASEIPYQDVLQSAFSLFQILMA